MSIDKLLIFGPVGEPREFDRSTLDDERAYRKETADSFDALFKDQHLHARALSALLTEQQEHKTQLRTIRSQAALVAAIVGGIWAGIVGAFGK